MKNTNNKNKVLVASAILILAGGVVAYMRVHKDIGLQQPAASVPVQAPRNSISEKAEIPSSSTEEELLSDSKQEQQTQHADPIGDTRQESPYLNSELKARLAQVADAYAETLKYPAFSKPIPNREALQKYLSNRSFEVERRLDYEGKMSPRVHLRTDKHHYFSGDDIKVMVSLSDLPDNSQVSLQARLIGGGQTLATVNASTVNQRPASYQLSFTDLDSLTDSELTEYRVVASINIDGKEHEVGVPVSYVNSIATVTNVGMAQVSGSYLYIPVNVTTNKPGYHELGANLYSAQSGKPLVHLSAKQELRSAQDLMQLTAHIVALKVRGDSGPYLLKDITLSRMPSAPGFTTEYGKSSKDSYRVNGYGFEEYDNVPYVDEEASQRLEFLRQVEDVN
jgi:hypothetical protein